MSLILQGGCFPPPHVSSRSSSSSARTRHAEAMAEKQAELEYVDDEGNVDWRRRIDAAKKILEEARSDRRWGRSEKALEKALDVARLMPPASKDFDLESELHGGDFGSNAKQTSEGGNQNEKGASGKGQGVGGGRKSEDGGKDEKAVTNAEVEEMRESLEELLESLDRSGGNGANLSLERNLIEIE